MVHIARSCTTGNELVGGIAIERHVLDGLGEGECLVVLHQYHTLGSRLAGDLGMSLQVGLVRILITLIAWTLLDEVEDALHVTVEIGLSEFAALHSSHDRVELFLLTRLQHVVACRHLHGTVLAPEPVGHNRSLIAPLVAEDGLYEFLALRSIDAVDIVIGGHHRPGLALLDGNLETLEVDLTEGTLGNAGIVAHAVGLLIVGSEVLDACTHVVLLHTGDIGTGSLTSHHGVLRVVFEVTATEGVAHDVQGRGQQHVGTILLHLLADGLTHLFDELGVPGRGKQGADGEVGTVIGGRVTLTGCIDAESGRTVGQYDGRDAERVERIGGTSGTRHEVLRGTDDGLITRESGHTCSDDEVGLVFERHLGHHFFLIDHFLGRGLIGCATASHQDSHPQ